jgi:hypothetical protein
LGSDVPGSPEMLRAVMVTQKGLFRVKYLKLKL